MKSTLTLLTALLLVPLAGLCADQPVPKVADKPQAATLTTAATCGSAPAAVPTCPTARAARPTA